MDPCRAASSGPPTSAALHAAGGPSNEPTTDEVRRGEDLESDSADPRRPRADEEPHPSARRRSNAADEEGSLRGPTRTEQFANAVALEGRQLKTRLWIRETDRLEGEPSPAITTGVKPGGIHSRAREHEDSARRCRRRRSRRNTRETTGQEHIRAQAREAKPSRQRVCLFSTNSGGLPKTLRPGFMHDVSFTRTFGRVSLDIGTQRVPSRTMHGASSADVVRSSAGHSERSSTAR